MLCILTCVHSSVSWLSGDYLNHLLFLLKTLNTLTEYCQGPCVENQNTVASHESNGLDIVVKELLLQCVEQMLYAIH